MTASTVLVFLLFSVNTGLSLRSFIDKLDQCENDNATVALIMNAKWDKSTTAPMQLYELELHVSRQTNVKRANLVADFQKCSTHEESSCGKFPSVRLKNVCDLFNIPQLPLKDLFDCLDEKVVNCVFKKRVYKGKRCKLQLEKFKMFPLGDSVWRARVRIDDRQSHLLCLSAVVHMN